MSPATKPESSPAMCRTGHASTLLCLLGLLALSCQSAEEWVLDADEEVYRIVQERRGQIFTDEVEFSVEPATDSLRQRIVAGEEPKGRVLSLVDCLQIAAENSREYQREKEDLYLDALDLTLERWRFAVQETGAVGGFLDGEGTEATRGGGTGFGQLAQLLGNGATWALSTGFEFARDLARGDGFDLVTNLGLSITQPLLRGSSQLVVEEPLTQAERNLVYGVRGFERFRRTFAVRVANRYWRLLQQVNAVENEQQNFDGLQVLRARNEALADAGRLSDIEVDQARQDEVRSENRLLTLRQTLAQDFDDFGLFMGIPVEFGLILETSDLDDLGGETFEARERDEESLARFALVERLDYRTVLDQFVDAERQALVRADGLRAVLGWRADVDASSDEGRPLVYRASNVDWTLGIDFDLGLERLPERNAYRAALIQVQRSHREQERMADSIRADLRESLRALRTNAKSYGLQSGAVTLAERRIESTTLNLEAGRATTRDLLEAQEDLLDARNAATGALVDYTLSELSLYLDLECLTVEETGLVLNEPMRIEP